MLPLNWRIFLPFIMDLQILRILINRDDKNEESEPAAIKILFLEFPVFTQEEKITRLPDISLDYGTPGRDHLPFFNAGHP